MAEEGGGDSFRSDLLLVIFALGTLVAVWFFSGAAKRVLQEGDIGAFLKPPAPLGSGEDYGKLSDIGSFTTFLGVGRKGFVEGEGLRSEIEQVKSDFAEVQKALEEANAPALRSPYFGKITISSTAGGAATTPADEFIILKASAGNASPIRITGWRIKSPLTGEGVEIPKGTYLPETNTVNTEEPIYLNTGDTAIITSGRSPIGVSFRTNKCTGYFGQFQSFNPYIDRLCPYPAQELRHKKEGVQFESACLDYIDQLPRCTLALDVNGLSDNCQKFLADNINYRACVDHHRNESDFYQKEWRVYLRREQELFRERREVIQLVDESGYTVDAATY